jgi:hypothetical protein
MEGVESYRVYWYSALRVRQALGRIRQLRGLNLQEQLKVLDAAARDQYIIAISGPALRFFRYATVEELKPKTFLISKRSKHKKIELQSFVAPGASGFPMVLFVFPRFVEGKALLEMCDEEVRFVTEREPVRVKASFKLKEMLTDGRLDL